MSPLGLPFVTSAITIDDDQDQLWRLPLPSEIIHQAIWLYVRFTLSFRDVEDLLAERGITVSYETVRRWVNHFGPMVAADLRAIMSLRRSFLRRTSCSATFTPHEAEKCTAAGRIGRDHCRA
jgi:hypothetical protein